MSSKDRPRITLAMILLAYGERLPAPVRRVVFRAYHAAADARLRVQASRPARYRLMVSDGTGPPVEWVRYDGQYKIPIPSAAEAVRRLVDAEERHPDHTWWIEHVPGARWHRGGRFDEDYADYL
jgi:hypothetical protein